ncbi:hypothetical protein F2Q68_00006867 [Brassica cretica]|uniref:Leucine-rich repeat-containing N-terminal plant-type domain-containing protein n=1 Tax=Brassica cretica TaxID=69181 RepID=A0A8S9JNH1_BRACR|nr:hypothetical protein F2Q68_00006867 [Brassica cretica]
MYLPCMSLMLFHLLALVCSCQASRFNDETDKQALVEFQSHLTENSRLVLASWNKSFHLCNWTGIICGRRHKRVTGLDLSGMKLTGAISPSIGNLSFLTSLILADNSFHGSIPLEVGKLFRLQHLNLSNNVLGGGISLGIPNCSALLTNDLSSNNLEHDASRFNDETDKQALVEFQTHLTENSRLVLASWNKSFHLCNWTGIICGRRHKRVTGLDLSGMKLTGAISPSIGNLSFLTSLILADNSFHGSIPLEVGKLFRLQHLNLSNNVLGGGISLGIPNCSALLTNDLSSNNLEHELGSLSSLVILSLRGNNLTGRYIIGDGSLVNMWEDPWIPNHPPRAPRPRRDITAGIKVNQFFDRDRK